MYVNLASAHSSGLLPSLGPNATDNGGGSEVIGNQGALLRDEPPRPLPPTLSSSALRRQETEGGHTVQPPREHVAQRFGDDKLWGPAAFDYRDHPLSLMVRMMYGLPPSLSLSLSILPYGLLTGYVNLCCIYNHVRNYAKI